MATALQEKMFGLVPLVRRTHPLWLDTAEVAAQLSAWRRSGRDRILWVSSKDSFFHRLMSARAQSPQLLLKASSDVEDELPYDACLCELSLSELSILPALYSRIRQLVADGAEILVYVHTLGRNPLRANPFAAYEELFPAVDVSTVHFHGNATTALIRKLFFKGTRHFAHKPRVRAVMAAITLLALAPFAWLANWRAGRRDASKFASGWTTAVLHFVVKKKPKIQPAAEIGQIGRESQGQTTRQCPLGSNCGLTRASTRAKRSKLGGALMGQGGSTPFAEWGPLTRQSGSQSGASKNARSTLGRCTPLCIQASVRHYRRFA